MIKAEFHIEIPRDRWIGEISRSYPDATFRLISGARGGAGTIQLGAVVADDPETIAAAAADHPSIASLEVLDRSGETLIGRYETTESGLYDFINESTLPPEYPIVVRDGWAEWDLTGSREELKEFQTWLENLGFDYELVSLVRADSRDGLLTDRQREVLRVAQKEGYFEIPRECTLGDLAHRFDIDKSTASEILRRAQGRLAAWHLTGSDMELEPLRTG